MWEILAIACLLALLPAAVLHSWRSSRRLTAKFISDMLREDHQCRMDQIRIRQENAFNRMAEGVLIVDSEGRVLLTNQTLREWFEWPRDIVGSTIAEAFSRDEVTDLVIRTRTGGIVFGTPRRFASAKGLRFRVNSANLPGPDTKSGRCLLVFIVQNSVKPPLGWKSSPKSNSRFHPPSL